MKKRVSVYLDEAIWEKVKDDAWKMRISASALFEKLVKGEAEVVDNAVRLAVDDAIAAGTEVVEEMVGQQKVAVLSSVLSDEEMDILEKGEKKRKEKFIPYSKDRQLGKKGAQ